MESGGSSSTRRPSRMLSDVERCTHKEGALSVLKAFLLQWSCPVTVTTFRCKGPTALLWDSCGSTCADLGSSNFIEAEVKENVWIYWNGCNKMRKWCTQAWSVLLCGKVGPLWVQVFVARVWTLPIEMSDFLAWSGIFFFSPRAGCRGAVISLLLPLTIQLEGVGTASLVVVMWSFLNVEQWNV